MRSRMNPLAAHRRFLALSGSLRAQSVNTAVLRALASLAPPQVTVDLFGGLGDLPHFNPDLDTPAPPESVVQFRAAIDQADALIICSPEYAHGVPGMLKNALDWLVSHPGFIDKRVCLINARPRSTWAIASLRETLTVMNARLVEAACVALPLDGNRHDQAALLALPPIKAALEGVLSGLLDA